MADAQGPDIFPEGLKSYLRLRDDLEFVEFGALGVDPATQIYAANGYGVFNESTHGALFKFDPGFVSPLHSHTYDYAAVVVEGLMQNYLEGEEPVTLGPGSMWFQKGHQAHTTTCVSETPGLIFIVQGHGFDAQIPPVVD